MHREHLAVAKPASFASQPHRDVVLPASIRDLTFERAAFRHFQTTIALRAQARSSRFHLFHPKWCPSPPSIPPATSPQLPMRTYPRRSLVHHLPHTFPAHTTLSRTLYRPPTSLSIRSSPRSSAYHSSQYSSSQRLGAGQRLSTSSFSTSPGRR